MISRLFLLITFFFASPAAIAADSPWDALRAGGYAVLIRHASAPGFGDPPEFKLGDCSTQRNLSEAGREESRRLGARFKQEKVQIAEVLSSRWCRCVDTAKLAFGKVAPIPEFDSFFADRSTESEQTAAARKRIANFRGPGNLVIVTHQVNMTALTGAFPGQGEAFVVKAGPAGKIELKFRIPPPQ
jgi:phosphohistidine phosphatase SixA